jgi:hypothetical protein
MAGKAENKASMKGSDNRQGKRKETIASDMSVGSSTGHGIRFTCPDHPDLSNVMRTPETK